MYDKSMGIIRDDIEGSVIEFVTRVVPFRVAGGCTSLGFENRQFVDVHFILAFSPKQPSILPDDLQKILKPLLPPGCLVIVYRRRGSVVLSEGKRSIELETEIVNIDAGDTATIEWANQHGQNLTAYEIYVVAQPSTVPDSKGQLLLGAIVAAMQ